MTVVKRMGLSARVLLAAAVMAIAACGNPASVSTVVDESGVLTVNGAPENTMYRAVVYAYSDAITDLDNLFWVIGMFEINGTGVGQPSEGAQRIRLQANGGAAWTSDGEFLVVLSDISAANNLVKYKDIVTFTAGAAALDYADMTDVPLYTVTFDTNGVLPTPAPQRVQYGGKASNPDIMKEDHILDGWYTDAGRTTKWDFASAPVIENRVLYAKWHELHTVTFDSNGGGNVPPQSVLHGETANEPKPAPARGDYTFAGWYPDRVSIVPYDFASEVTSAITIYAKWQGLHSVIFDTDGGVNIPLQEVPHGQKAVRPAPDPAKEGHSFDWYKDIGRTTAYNFDDPVNAGIIIYAGWKPNNYTLYLVLMDTPSTPAALAAGWDVSTVYPYNTELAVLPSAARVGYSFEGWWDTPMSDSGTRVTSVTITESITLYARWGTN
jgi:uncharacterized repeat protein (TIGR02543 family)